MAQMKKNYTGRCHCGDIRFSFLSEEITEGRRCNCSLCIRRGFVMSASYIPSSDFVPHQDLSQLSVYKWNDRLVDAIFCKRCAIFPYFGNDQWGYRVNLGCVEQIDALTLKSEILDGRSMPLSEDPGPHPGDT
jgi:hypothetical protein